MIKEMNWLKSRIRDIQRIENYAFDSCLKKVLDEEKVIKLNANENFFVPQPFLRNILEEVIESLDPRLYPQREEERLISALEDYTGFPADWIVTGNGADQIIEYITKAFLKHSEEALSISPTFPMYRIIVKAQGNQFNEVSINNDFSLNVDNIQKATHPKTVLCFICSPNNPTANQFNKTNICRIIEEFNGIVILDEAYVEFAPETITHLVNEFDNLIVLRTFSKIFGLAGLRVGYSIANPNISASLRKMQLPYNMNTFSQRVALRLLEEPTAINDALTRLKGERTKFIQRLNTITGIKAYNSATNFTLVKTNRSSDYVYNQLLDKNILVRKMGEIMSYKGYIRITVGLPEMNMILLNGLKEILS
ncbi:MAG: histidinol-phosphate transaminase [Candidatus Bathyarchaeota archaeon]|nr:MAG: histidinol-phosphate transaminase [Candidatus Bathyarchaeota archaeon]